MSNGIWIFGFKAIVLHFVLTLATLMESELGALFWETNDSTAMFGLY